MRLQNFDPAAFLRDTWQRRPLLIRNPWTRWRNPLQPDELAGLACEGEVESRLVVQAGTTWSLEHGPLAEERFGRLGADPWTLLVQAVDHHVPAVADLIAPFRFLPNWRIDDVMVSYASDRGGVGPHFDNYDVFLIQGLGRRRWRVGPVCDAAAPLLPHDDLRLLADFAASEEWVLEPGDILYLPPRFAHEGVALGDDCMTYSIGFRAPSHRELIAGWCDAVLADIPEDDFYTDPGLAPQANPGEISAAALARLHALVTASLADRDGFAAWFGRHTTAPRNPEIDWSPDKPATLAGLRRKIAKGAALLRNPASRFAFIRQAGATLLFVDGESHPCQGDAIALAEQLCAPDHITLDPGLSDAGLALIHTLHNRGSLALES